MEFVADQHIPQVHPNAYGPSSLQSCKRLGGGGSGVTVFKGEDREIGSLVMKHGGYKDTKELFALAKISTELRKRSEKASLAADDMIRRLPEFRMIYISPHHLKTRPRFGSDIWSKLCSALSVSLHGFSFHMGKPDVPVLDSLPEFVVHGESGSVPSAASTDPKAGDESTKSNGTDTIHKTTSHENVSTSTGGDSPLNDTGLDKGCRAIRLFTGEGESASIKVHSCAHNFDLHLGQDDKVLEDGEMSLWYGLPSDGCSCLEPLVKKLRSEQQKQNWKFTLGQKKIGGTRPKSASKWLTEGLLEGELLDTLIWNEIRVIRNLQQLTSEKEADVAIADVIRKELDEQYEDVFYSPASISDDADRFVGLAIKKNWHPETGRFHKLRRIGEAFREKRLSLTAEENLPAHYLGQLLKDEANMADVFKGAPSRNTALDSKGSAIGTWRQLIRDAISLKSAAALSPIWNCGLSDGGLHNMFLSQDDMYLFDLGEPTVQPVPAFLTKFLFSFFHGLGMQDDDIKGCGWVNRFNLPRSEREKLSLTKESICLIPKAYNAFRATLNTLVDELFDGEDDVRSLLISYVTLQLLSDAAFCLEKWTTKGGGQSRNKNHHKHIEEWLWRSIWDVYIASDLNSVARLRYLGVRRKPNGRWLRKLSISYGRR
jgi:hypothetical protein